MAPLSKHQREFVKTLVVQILDEEKLDSSNIDDSAIEAVFNMYSDIVNSNTTPSEKHAVLIATIVRLLVK